MERPERIEDGFPTTDPLLSTGEDTPAPATLAVVFSTLIAVSGSFVFGSAVGFSSPAQNGIIKDLGLSVAEYSVFGSIWTIGAMIGAVMSGKLADLFARRGAMGFSELFCLLGWLAIIFGKNALWLDIGRFLMGYGVGIISYVVPVYIAEITPKNLRGAFTTVNQLMICCGVSLMYVVGVIINWRLLAVIGAIPCIIQLFGLFFIPESPRWLAKAGQWKECEASLQRLRGKDANISEEAAEIKIQEFKSQTLFSVSVKQNQLEGPIPKSFLNQQGLYYLILSQNNLSGHIDSAICDLNLGVLNLGSCNLDGTIPQCLGEMSELWVLDLSNNSLSGTMNTTFRIGNQLRVIKMDGNKLEGKVPRSLINCKYLELFDLGNNELNATFPKCLGVLPDLQILNLRSNKLHGLINDLRTDNLFAKILVIDLSFNGFSGGLPVSLFENFQAMKIIGESSGIPEYVADTYSTLHTNSLIVTTKGLDLELARILTTNIIINLSNNRFEGDIPIIIGDLVGLRTLNLSHNRLEGHIPASLQHLSVLESLDLSSNKINGEIPQQLASLVGQNNNHTQDNVHTK